MCNQHRKSPADMIEHANATCKFASPLSSSSVARSSLTKRTVRVISRMAFGVMYAIRTVLSLLAKPKVPQKVWTELFFCFVFFGKFVSTDLVRLASKPTRGTGTAAESAQQLVSSRHGQGGRRSENGGTQAPSCLYEAEPAATLRHLR